MNSDETVDADLLEILCGYRSMMDNMTHIVDLYDKGQNLFMLHLKAYKSYVDFIEWNQSICEN